MTRAWAKLVVHAFVVAAVVVAAELGAAQALRLIRWDDDFGSGAANSWPALLTWVGFTYAVAVLAGAVAGRRAARRPTRPDGIVARVLAVLVAAAGAAAAVVLVWLPAGDVRPPTNVDPSLVVTLTAVAGIVVGAMIALLALSVAPVAGNVGLTVVWVWLLAIGSALAGSTLGGSAEETPRPAPKLGVADLPTLIPVDQWWSGPSLMIGMAIALGVLVALVARWGGGSRPAIALSGLAGPLLVAAAYLLAGPGSAGSAGLASSAGASQLDAYRMALIAVAAGLFASALIAAPRRATHDRRLSTARRPAAEPVVDEPDIEPFLADETSTWDGRPTTSPPDTGLLDKGLPDKGPQDKVLLEHGIPNQRRPDEDRPAVGWFDAGLHPAPAPDLRPYVSLAAYPGGEPERSQPATAYQADPTVMGQPERQFDDEYVDWVSEIGLPETTKRGGRHR